MSGDPLVIQLPLGSHRNFVYLIGCGETGQAAVVDPAWDTGAILRAAEENALTVGKILLTHTHADHTNGVGEIVARTGSTVLCHEAEARTLSREPDVLLHDGDVVQVGGVRVAALHTPGHSPGGLCYLAGGHLLTGDTLFVGRTGRTVFQGSSDEAMWESIQRLRELPEELTVWPGHDYGPSPSSTIGRERRENPFFGAGSLEAFRKLREEWEARHG
jgi:glyoxylase-like metal-dependent hydrolase (beta-lactamase superfamily II)